MELNPTAIAAAGLALVASYALLWLLNPLAHRLGWLDRPTQPRKRHQAPTPVTGGPAIFLAALLAGVATSMPMSAAVWGLVAGGSLLLVVGLLDDVYDLRWYWRIGAQVLAALLMMPILTFVADIGGLVGGLLVSWITMDLSPTFFISRLIETVELRHFWIGMSKAPFLALLIAAIGCRQGLLVEGDTQSLGRHVTAAVVHAIFLIIMFDAIFAVIFMVLDL